ncbi:kinase-like domain-containing protein [Halteromyces radiatus]|uniref:kinase-like domain-containing protein n=1 Tax=Halteromyces radiatus TaxID=101107 RepID=UPI00221FCBED|nr:kinase-like domain-containing protein [Halteromyces radiatus]KAI8099543.1 kinase-like domain-containing protein [Halteromyces radiatus]
MRVVGRGAFGKVRIVEHRETRQLYAMKYINKEECIRMDAVRNIIRERTILEQLDHPFLCRLRFAFQDNICMYMVTDLMLGGDLYYHISANQYFSEDVLRFWFAELSSAVKYLHFNGVVHRDIKPQNILMDEWGHVHLTDFNIATYLHSNRLLTSGSGTSYYMAPEVLKGGGYNEAVDWWGLGVTLYECVYGKKPFDHELNDELSAAIRRGHVHYSNSKRSISGECLSVMQGFLEMVPTKRLGQGDHGWISLVQHPFFRSVDWRRLESKTLTPPFQPATNQNNFDPTFDLEQMVVDDFGSLQDGGGRHHHRLNDRHRKSTDTSKHERDRTMIKEKFKPFDFTIFEKYEGFKDPVKRTVGEPPDWVKPAFDGADRDLLPITRIDMISNPSNNDQQQQHTHYIANNQPIKNMNHNITTQENHNSPLTLSIDTHRTSRFAGKKDSAGGPLLWRSQSTNNLASRAGFLVDTSSLGSPPSLDDTNMVERVRKRRSLGTYQQQQHRGISGSPLVPSSPMMDISFTPTDDGLHSLPMMDDQQQQGAMTSLSEEYAMSLQGVRKKQSTRSFRERRERDRKSIHH